MRKKKPILPILFALLFGALVIATCRVTVIQDKKAQTAISEAGEEVAVVQLSFAEQYAKENWDTKIMPAIREQAVDISIFIEGIRRDLAAEGQAHGYRANETSPWSFSLKGTAKVIDVENPEKVSQTRLLLDAAPYDGEPDIKLQVSTVIKTNAIRDGVGFLKLDDFTNQVEFAELTKAFNNIIKSNLLMDLDTKSLIGKEIVMLGCVSTQTGALDDLLIVPVELSESEG